MSELINFLEGGRNLTDLLSVLIVLGALLVGAEVIVKKGIEWSKAFYDHMKGKEAASTTLNKNTEDIQSLSTKIDELAVQMNEQYTVLNAKIDANESKGKQRDCAILRDSILRNMRHFNDVSKDEDGIVHISETDYEDMQHLFDEYFAAGGNGLCHRKYETEFKHWIVD